MSRLYDWSKLPKGEKPKVEKALNDYDLDTLLELYYEYKMGPIRVCCPNENFYIHFKYAIDNNLI